MNWLLEAQRAVTGSVRLLFRDTGGFDDFNLTTSGFWRSFTAVIPIAPFYLYAATIKIPRDLTEQAQQAEHVPKSIGSALLILLITWATWPIIMAAVSRIAGLAHNFSRYIIVFNWCHILVVAAQMIPAALIAQGGQMTELGSLVYYAFLAVALYYHWYIAVKALETTMAMAWVLVLANLILDIVLNSSIG